MDKEKILILIKKMDSVVDFIEKELKILEGDAYLTEVIFNSFEAKTSEEINKKIEIMKEFKYNEGMFDAYHKILQVLENTI